STVIGYSPLGSAAPPVSVSTLSPGALTGFGEKSAVAPAGTPVAARFTGPEKPLSTPTRRLYDGSVEVVAPQSSMRRGVSGRSAESVPPQVGNLKLHTRVCHDGPAVVG